MLEVVRILIAVATIATGLFSLLRPRAVTGFTGLTTTGPRGITEIRAVLGGAFVALGVAPLLLGSLAAYQMLGITYLTVGLARFLSMIVDRSWVSSNWISLGVEVVFGLLLIV
jgi:hypothetical protein